MSPTFRRMLLLFCGLAPWAAHAAEWELLSIGVRAQVWDQTALGKQQPEPFDQYDLTVTARTPWASRSWASWTASSRLLASVGALRGAGKTGVVATAIPALAFTHRTVPLTLDAGAGLALLSVHRFGTQEYGGPLQFALTAGASVTVFRHVGIGYRFLHYSDARLYGSGTVGADFHMIELSYAF